jgi:hypothetical protein
VVKPVTTMMALRAHARGGPEQLIYEPAPVPAPGSGEALIAVHAGGNYLRAELLADSIQRRHY